MPEPTAALPLPSPARRAWRSKLAFAAAVALACSATARGAAAQASNQAAAEALFSEAHKLLQAGDVHAACLKFEGSQRLDPGTGTLLNLALCHEKEGKIATAWAEFRDVARLAGRAGQSEREEFARKKESEIAPGLPKLVVRLADANAAAEVDVRLDGAPLLAGSLGVAIPVDPGAHAVEAVERASKRAWSNQVTLAKGATSEVVVPAFMKDAAGAGPVVTPPPPGAGAPQAAEPARADDAGDGGKRTRRILGWSVGGAGLVAGGFAVVYAVVSGDRSKGAESARAAGDETRAKKFDEQAGMLQGYAIAAGVAGGVAVAAGVVLILTAAPGPGGGATGDAKGARSRAWVVPVVGSGVAGAAVGGAF